MIRWRLFQKQLLTCQAKVNKVMSVKSTEKGNKSSGKSKFDREELEICDTTPKTRRKSMSIKVNKSKKKHISLTPLAKKIKLKLKTNVKKSPSSKEISKKQIRRKSNESKKENRNEVVVEKKKMSPKYKTPRNNNSFSNSKTGL